MLKILFVLINYASRNCVQIFFRARGLQEVGHATVANRTAKGPIGRISAFFAEIKALFGRGDLSLRTSIIQPVFEHPLNSKTKSHSSRPYHGGSFPLNEDKHSDSSKTFQRCDLLLGDFVVGQLSNTFGRLHNV